MASVRGWIDSSLDRGCDLGIERGGRRSLGRDSRGVDSGERPLERRDGARDGWEGSWDAILAVGDVKIDGYSISDVRAITNTHSRQ